jgi:hypothetical protein
MPLRLRPYSLLLPLLLLTLTACATLKDNELLAQAGVQYATAKFVRSAGDEAEQTARAGRIRTISGELRKVVGTEAVSVPALQAAVQKYIPTDLKPEDRVLVNLLVAAVVQELERRIGDQLLKPDQLLVVNSVLQWVDEGTQLISTG